MTIIKGKDIPYFSLAQDVFSEDGQMFIPFLGAGVSISDRQPTAERKLTSSPPDRSEIDQALNSLRLKGKGRTFVELAILLGYLIDFEEIETTQESTEEFQQRLMDEPYPPSASELALLFARTANYSTFVQVVRGLRRRFPEQLLSANEEEQVETLQLLSKVTRIAHPPEALTSITSYYEKLLGRQRLWKLLKEIFESKKVPTPTHRLLAQAAKFNIGRLAQDYLIITTNYDCLMEKALDELEVPYVVLTTKRGNDPKVLTRFASTIPNCEALKEEYSNKVYPVDFHLEKEKEKRDSWVVIFKIHGCLSPEAAYPEDGLVISDNDYVSYVTRMGKKGSLIPSHVSRLMRDKPFWFLGYSLSDWNVRSIYETLKQSSDPDKGGLPDYSVMYSVGEFEKLFFEKNNITIFQASLNEFVEGILKNLPKRVHHIRHEPSANSQ
jgi:SIR2-like domain